MCDCDDTRRLGRRGFVKLGVGGFLGLLVERMLQPRLALADDWVRPPTAAPAPGKGKACILLWMNGGPSHIDTWDPKPGRKTGGSFKAIKTRTPDVQICEHLPRIAEISDRLAIIRGMTSREGNHQRARYLMHTGYVPNPTVMHPSLGGWMSEEVGDPDYDLPMFVSVNGPSLGAGFLGVQYGPFVVQNAKKPPQNVTYPRNVDGDRFNRRQAALDWMEQRFDSQSGDSKVGGRRAVYAKSVRLMHSPRLSTFNIAEEPASTLAAYGDTDFGRGCLMARRLVEQGVRFVEVVLDGWDTHQDNFSRTTDLMKALDPGMSALIKDLEQRKLLDSTLVMWMGEFGRTPTINPNDGRDHFPQAWSAVLAGAGIRHGIVRGQTDTDGTKVVANAVGVPDFFATVATALGLDPTKSKETPAGRPISISDSGKVLRDLLA
jgi:hypothetical protein